MISCEGDQNALYLPHYRLALPPYVPPLDEILTSIHVLTSWKASLHLDYRSAVSLQQMPNGWRWRTTFFRIRCSNAA